MMTAVSCHLHPSSRIVTCIVAVALALTSYSAKPALAYTFTPSSLTAPINLVGSNAVKRGGVGRAAGTQEENPPSLAVQAQRRRASLISRKARVRPRSTTTTPTSAGTTQQQQSASSERVGDVGDLVRCVFGVWCRGGQSVLCRVSCNISQTG